MHNIIKRSHGDGRVIWLCRVSTNRCYRKGIVVHSPGKKPPKIPNVTGSCHVTWYMTFIYWHRRMEGWCDIISPPPHKTAKREETKHRKQTIVMAKIECVIIFLRPQREVRPNVVVNSTCYTTLGSNQCSCIYGTMPCHPDYFYLWSDVGCSLAPVLNWGLVL